MKALNFILFISMLAVFTLDGIVFSDYCQNERKNAIEYRLTQPLAADSRDYPAYQAKAGNPTVVILATLTIIGGFIFGLLCSTSPLFRGIIMMFLAVVLVLDLVKAGIRYIKNIE